MRRLLLLTYYYPPHPEAGALRPSYLKRYLPQYGWEVTVVTRPPSASVHTKLDVNPPIKQWVKRSGLGRAIKAFVNPILNFPDAARRWGQSALRQASNELATQSHDAVMSTAPPATMHIVGNLAAQRAGLPWLADYRDLWTGNPYRNRHPILISLERRLELRTLKSAAAVTTVSEACANSLASLLHRQDIEVIPNGYDLSDWRGIEDKPPTTFQLCYAGRLYPHKRTPDLLFEALSSLRKNNDSLAKRVRIEFFGPETELVTSSAKRYGVTDLVVINGIVNRDIVMSAERASAVLLLFLASHKDAAGEIGSKIFEYFGAHRPVLALGPPESGLRPMLEESGLGIFVSSLESCVAALRKLYDDFERGIYKPSLRHDWRPFEASALAHRFATALNRIVDGH